ncbi:MAG: hypothetical protein FJW30_02280 [Acidobacteria bacterium]|nr:hypothetical protein [Acidobacteriota bacterium]
MRIKSYFVHNMEDALQRAKLELGEDAMLVNTRPMAAPEGGRPRLEVVFAITEPVAPPPRVAVVEPRPGQPWSQFRGDLSSLLDALERTPDPKALAAVSPAKAFLDQLHGRLMQADVPRELIEEVSEAARLRLEQEVLQGRPISTDGLVTLLPAVETASETEQARQRRIALVGPPGAGKTATIAKLGFWFCVTRRLNTLVVSTDSVRIGAADQLARLCRLMGIPFEHVASGASLSPTIQANSHRAVILIDTPGAADNDSETQSEIAAALNGVDPVERHAVVPAVLRLTDMNRRLDALERLCPSHLLFTRMDETSVFGPMWALARQRSLPLSWCSTGPCVPDDIEAADAMRLARVILKPSDEKLPLPPPRVSAAGASAS